MQSQACISLTHIMLFFRLNNELVHLQALQTHCGCTRGPAQLWQEQKGFGLSDKNGEFTGGFGHQIHVVNQKLDLEGLMGRMS